MFRPMLEVMNYPKGQYTPLIDSEKMPRKVEGTGRVGAGKVALLLLLLPGANGSSCPQPYVCETGKYIDPSVTPPDIWEAACAESVVHWETAENVLSCDMATDPRELVSGIEADFDNLVSSLGCNEIVAADTLCRGEAPESVHEVVVWSNGTVLETPLALMLIPEFENLTKGILGIYTDSPCHGELREQVNLAQALALNRTSQENFSAAVIVALNSEGSPEIVIDKEGCIQPGILPVERLSRLKMLLVQAKMDKVVQDKDDELVEAIRQRNDVAAKLYECNKGYGQCEAKLRTGTEGGKVTIDPAEVTAGIEVNQ